MYRIKILFCTVKLGSGLGNQLFQLGFLHFSAVLFNAQPFLEECKQSPHSNKNYFQSLFKNHAFLQGIKPKGQKKSIKENTQFGVENWIEKAGTPTDTILEFSGYFQQWVYMDGIRDSFLSSLDWQDQQHLKAKYPDIHSKTFVHIRGGDYLQPGFAHHFIDLINYYRKCQRLCGESEFVIFTNDKRYAEQLVEKHNLFSGASFIHENEIDTLYLMSQCKACICANSTFSWWGAYLNTNRMVYLPSQWFKSDLYGINIEGYFFPGSTRVDVTEPIGDCFSAKNSFRNTVIVTGYYTIPSKRSHEFYYENIRRFFTKLKDQPILFFTDTANHEKLREYAGKNVHFFLQEFDELPLFKELPQEFWKAQILFDPEKYHSWQLGAMWASKAFFVQQASEISLAEKFIWVDAGCVRDDKWNLTEFLSRDPHAAKEPKVYMQTINDIADINTKPFFKFPDICVAGAQIMFHRSCIFLYVQDYIHQVKDYAQRSIPVISDQYIMAELARTKSYISTIHCRSIKNKQNLPSEDWFFFFNVF